MKSQCAGPRADRELAVLKKVQGGDSLAVQGLRLHTSTAQGAGSTPGQGTKMLHSKVEIITIKGRLDTQLGKLWCLGKK